MNDAGPVQTHLQGFILVLLHGGDALVLGVDARGHAGLHHRVAPRRRLNEKYDTSYKEGSVQTESVCGLIVGLTG